MGTFSSSESTVTSVMVGGVGGVVVGDVKVMTLMGFTWPSLVVLG